MEDEEDALVLNVEAVSAHLDAHLHTGGASQYYSMVNDEGVEKLLQSSNPS